MAEWTMETDADAEARHRTGAIDGRYQICHPAEGLIETADTLGEAFSIGDRYAARKLPSGGLCCSTPEEIEVYDRMARRGQPRTWRRHHGRGEPVTYKVEHGDRHSMSAFWKVIERREK